ncbi:MAG: class I SAM-dependent methyltransferase [Verrucomicrobiae bacterium]|nr:class I SAM-dependent methyltransferase [Verrucomicrobiae bacterium]NNJ43159.1 class I SAM-dependent methyltransferase [Akkermansiaceae bacterium]
MKQEIVEGSLLETAHALIDAVVHEGDVVVDATVGNGHDTLFLANCVGVGGRVIGFDLQQDAIDSASRHMSESGIGSGVYDLHLLGHELMAAHLPMGVAAVMFNLGYLPGGDKGVITQVSTTLQALDSALHHLRGGGVLSVMCYPGHLGGDAEAQAVAGWFDRVAQSVDSATCYQRRGARETTPFLLVAQKS